MAKTEANFAIGNGHADLDVLAGGVAIVTGGASGIGLALAERAIQGRMHTVCVDIEESAIAAAELQLRPLADDKGVDILGVPTDVSLEESVQALRDTVARKFPSEPISFLACNAGVGAGGGVLTAGNSDWDFVLGVNLMGVVYCLRAFVPKMIEQDAPAAVMATSSQDGLCCAQGVYGVSKHACVALMEAVHGEVANRISVHVLCPNVVATNIVTSLRNRPDRFGGVPAGMGRTNPVQEGFKKYGMPPSRCAEFVFDAIQNGVFYVMAEAADDPGYVRLEVETRMNAILNGTRPSRPQSQLIAKVFRGIR